MPIIPRLEFYKKILSHTVPDHLAKKTYYTLDENFIIVAMWMKRQKKIKSLTLVSACSCCDGDKTCLFEVDENGEVDGEFHHGFFSQRLAYLAS